MAKHYLGGSAKTLTSAQIKFSQLFVYGVEGSPITKREAASLAGYKDPDSDGARLTNPNKFPLVCAYISNLRDEIGRF